MSIVAESFVIFVPHRPGGLSGCRSYICFTSCGSKRRRTRDSSAMAAHDLPKVEVGGSTPLYRSTHSSSGYSYNDLLFSPLIRDGLEGMQVAVVARARGSTPLPCSSQEDGAEARCLDNQRLEV